MARAGARLGVTGLLLLGASNSLQNAVAEGDTRTLSFRHVHTGENITITFKRDGRYDEAALKKLDWFMRDWRKEQETHMDPHLFDLLWETYREVGASEPIQVICGYRSPGTNSMLRARSNGVAQFSQHINGNAIDFYIPGVPLATVRAEGLRLQRGGVGFYPTSGSPFVHLDTGTIRHWPRIPRQELAKIFPDGRTVHIPADGQPLPGYALALADVERQGAVPSGTSLEAAREAGVITASQEHAAEQPKRSLLARIFGIGKKRAEQNEQPTAKHARTPMAVASLGPPKRVAAERMPKPVAIAAVLPRPRPAEQKIATASLASNLFDNRGYWRGAIEFGTGTAGADRGRHALSDSLGRTRQYRQHGRQCAGLCRGIRGTARGAHPADGFAPAPHAGGSPGDPGLVQHRRGGEAAASVHPRHGRRRAFRQPVAARRHADAECARLHDGNAGRRGRSALAARPTA